MIGVSSRNTTLGVILLVLALSVFMYGHSVTHNQFATFDDGSLVQNNPLVQELSPQTFHGIFTSYDPELYIPLTLFSYQLTNAVFGMHAWAFHAGDLALHAANSLLVFWFVILLVKRRDIALVTCLLFLCHPIQTEAVCWIAGRKDLLSGFFFLSSLIAFVSYLRSQNRSLYFFSLLLFLFALLSKVSALSLPFVLLLVTFFERRTLTKQTLLDLIPFLALSILFGIIAMIGKTGLTHGIPVATYSLLAARSMIFLLGKILFPVHFSVLYPLENPLVLLTAPFILSACTVLLLGAIIIIAWRRRWSFVWFGLCFFAVTAVPTFFNLFKIDRIFISSDRYAYIPSIGIFLLVAIALHSIGSRYSTLRHAAFLILIGMGIACLALLSRAQSAVWQDGITLFSDVLRSYPTSAFALDSRAYVKMTRGEYDEAIADRREAVRLEPMNPDLHTNLARSYSQKDMNDQALNEFEQALRLDPARADTHMALAVFFKKIGRLDDARAAMTNAKILDPMMVETKANAAFSAEIPPSLSH